jgi:hypothetical protein
MYGCTLSLTLAPVGVMWLTPRAGRFTAGNNPVRLVWEVGPQGRSGRLRKISSPPGFDPRTVQPLANRYTN